MTASRLYTVSIPVLMTSAAAWLILLTGPGDISAHIHAVDSFVMALAMQPPRSLALGWVVMLMAMMLPTLIAPIAHVVDRSFRRRRKRAVALFLAGYIVTWMLIGPALLGGLVLLRSLLPAGWLPPLAVIAFATVVWQCSPAKQRCLNRNHRHPPLSAFGFAADRDAARFGWTHGIWCIASCWALMLLVASIPTWHFIAMGAITLLMVSERLEPPERPKWKVSARGKLFRIIAAQLQVRVVTRPAPMPPRFEQ